MFKGCIFVDIVLGFVVVFNILVDLIHKTFDFKLNVVAIFTKTGNLVLDFFAQIIGDFLAFSLFLLKSLVSVLKRQIFFWLRIVIVELIGSFFRLICSMLRVFSIFLKILLGDFWTSGKLLNLIAIFLRIELRLINFLVIGLFCGSFIFVLLLSGQVELVFDFVEQRKRVR